MRRSKTWRAASIRFMNDLRTSRSPETMRGINHRLNRFLNQFGDQSPSELTIENFENWFNQQRLELKPNSYIRIRREAIRLIRSQGLPIAERISLRRIPNPMPQIQTLSDEDWRTVAYWVNQNIHSQIMWKSRVSAYLSIVMTSGMRSSEACSLMWEDWNQETNRIHLTKTKTGQSRFALVTPWTSEVLETWRQRIPDSQRIMPRLTDFKSPIPGSVMRNYVSRVKKELELVQLNSKIFRSTLVKKIIESGGSFEDAASIVGHSSTQTTTQFYHRISVNQSSIDAHQEALKGLLWLTTIGKGMSETNGGPDGKRESINWIEGGIPLKFECKICETTWELTTFTQCDEIQKIQCPKGHPHQNHVLKAVISQWVHSSMKRFGRFSFSKERGELIEWVGSICRGRRTWTRIGTHHPINPNCGLRWTGSLLSVRSGGADGRTGHS